jgi:hypothetical protein
MCVVVLGGLFAVWSNGCGSTQPDDPLTIVGTVKMVQGSHVWSLVSISGTAYQPINLPAEYKKEGITVRVLAKVRPDIAGLRSRGPFIEILEIARRD